ncbi:MFS transporter [Bacillus coahuilensis]|uniref:MFS transporter n=1 Tax=Bacillus coahuilensis TaxID=408580 RepID=UPI0001850A5F|nr:MFS transporter [Bacillus coahuilensis]
MISPRTRFWILVSIVAISGLSQGMLLPIIAIIFEQDGISSSLNGLHATGIYIGILLASPFMEEPLRRMGYKRMIIIGGFVVAVSLLLFPVWQSFWFWFILRLAIGIGDHMLHFSTQTWITSFSTKETRGRNVSLYGVSFGIGFAVGPLFVNLLSINQALPFIISSGLSFMVWGLVFFLGNEYPEKDEHGRANFFGSFHRFGKVWKYAWVALLPPFGYGVLEASLNGNFPIYAIRSGMDTSAVSIILPAFAFGGILFQFPLGILSDRFGREVILKYILLIGGVSFFVASFFEESSFLLTLLFFIAGLAVGSTFSLGISYMADLLPHSLLPAGNIMCGILFSIGSIVGPIMGGLVIQYVDGISFFHFLAALLVALFISMVYFSWKQSFRGMVKEGKN